MSDMEPVYPTATAAQVTNDKLVKIVNPDTGEWHMASLSQLSPATVLSFPTGVAATDTAAINAAITASNAAGGGIVVIAADYVVALQASTPIATKAAAIVMKSGVHLVVHPVGSVKLAGGHAVTTDECAIIRNEGAFATSGPYDHDMSVSGPGVIDGNAINNTNIVCAGVAFGTAERVFVYDLNIKNCRGTSPGPPGETFGLAFYRCANYGARNVNVFTDDGGATASGIGSSFCSVGRIENCATYNLGFGVGNSHYRSTSVQVVNCHSYSNGGNGFLTEGSRDVSFIGCMAGGIGYDAALSTLDVGPIDADEKFGNGQDTTASAGTAAGFGIFDGTRISIIGGHACYTGTDAFAGCGIRIYGTASEILVDGCRVFGNTIGVQFANGDGTAAVTRAKATHFTKPWLVGPNKAPGGGGSNREFVNNTGDMSVTSGTINGFLCPAVPATTVAADNRFAFDCWVKIIGGTWTEVTVTPGGPAPSAAVTFGTSTNWIRVPRGATIAVTYSGAPTWTWHALN